MGELTSSGNYYYLFDALGSVAGLSDSTGNLVGGKNYKYDPFGTVLDGQTIVSNPWRFASGHHEGDRPTSTGLYKFGTRYYDPAVGRWTQPDPTPGALTDPLTLNWYLYSAEDPVNAVDPSGRCWTGLCWAEHAYEGVTTYLEEHRWARCALFVGGILAMGAGGYLAASDCMPVIKHKHSGARSAPPPWARAVTSSSAGPLA